MRPLILTSPARIGFLLLCLKHLFFGLEPVVEFRARLITSLDVEFVGSSPDSFFVRKRLDRGFVGTRRGRHGDHLWQQYTPNSLCIKKGPAHLQPSLPSFARRFSALNGVQLSFPDRDLEGFRIATPKVESDPASAVMPPYLGRNRYQQMMGS